MDYGLGAFILTLIINIIVVVHWAGRVSQRVEDLRGDIKEVKSMMSDNHDKHGDRILDIERDMAKLLV